MAYATQADLERLFGIDEINQLSDRDNDTINDFGVIDGALDDATSEINSYIANKYAVPLSSVSDYMKKVCSDIARFHLHKDAATQEVVYRYERAINWLKDLSAGRAVLTDASAVPLPSGGSVKYQSNARLFTDTTLVNY